MGNPCGVPWLGKSLKGNRNVKEMTHLEEKKRAATIRLLAETKDENVEASRQKNRRKRNRDTALGNKDRMRRGGGKPKIRGEKSLKRED